MVNSDLRDTNEAKKAGRPKGLKTSLRRIPQEVFEHPVVREALLACWMEALQEEDPINWERKFDKIMERYPPRTIGTAQEEFEAALKQAKALLQGTQRL